MAAASAAAAAAGGAATGAGTQVRVEGMAVTPLKDFASAKMPAEVMTYVTERGWTQPTQIQSHCWPVLNAGRDVVGIAETGSGKTLAFSLPVMSRIFKARKVGRACVRVFFCGGGGVAFKKKKRVALFCFVFAYGVFCVCAISGLYNVSSCVESKMRSIQTWICTLKWISRGVMGLSFFLLRFYRWCRSIYRARCLHVRQGNVVPSSRSVHTL